MEKIKVPTYHRHQKADGTYRCFCCGKFYKESEAPHEFLSFFSKELLDMEYHDDYSTDRNTSYICPHCSKILTEHLENTQKVEEDHAMLKEAEAEAKRTHGLRVEIYNCKACKKDYWGFTRYDFRVAPICNSSRVSFVSKKRYADYNLCLDCMHSFLMKIKEIQAQNLVPVFNIGPREKRWAPGEHERGKEKYYYCHCCGSYHNSPEQEPTWIQIRDDIRYPLRKGESYFLNRGIIDFFVCPHCLKKIQDCLASIEKVEENHAMRDAEKAKTDNPGRCEIYRCQACGKDYWGFIHYDFPVSCVCNSNFVEIFGKGSEWRSYMLCPECMTILLKTIEKIMKENHRNPIYDITK